LPELEAGPWALGGLIGVAAVGLVLPTAWQRRAAAVLLGLMLALLVGAGTLAQYRLYRLGHDRGHTPLARVNDFTPPVLGSVKVQNFEVRTGLKPGGWTYVGAIALCAGGLAWTRPGRQTRAAPRNRGLSAPARSRR
jgi:hypothetical protein